MADIWLISVPLDKTSLTSLEKLKRTIAKTNLASCCRFSIPELKVGMAADLSCVFCFPEGIPGEMHSLGERTCQCLKEVMEQSSDKVLENTLANGVDLLSYATKFQWDRAKYPTALPLRSLVDKISKQVLQVETELKSRSAAYNSLKASLKSLERKTEGSLQTRNLNDIVRREDLVDSEYLTTLLVVVARGSYVQWERSYESLSQFVVPRSSKLYEDREGGVFSVTLFKRAVGEFKAKARQSKFTVREYNFDLEEQQHQEMKQLGVAKKEQYVSQTVFYLCVCVHACPQGIFVRWLKVNFSELFVAWIHLKALRVYVESVLRYGLPVGFQALLLQPDKKHMKKLREELASLFKHLDPTAAASKTDVRGHTQLPRADYNPVVFKRISFSVN
uniref:V-type proton ATPase subunit C n=1 Tax=Myripristis murdjan TaxID=586833 RepID=A0A667ZT88_9TELE